MSADTCVRPSEKNKTEQQRTNPSPSSFASPTRVSLTVCLCLSTPPSPSPLWLSVGLNGSCDFLPVVLTPGSLCLRVSLLDTIWKSQSLFPPHSLLTTHTHTPFPHSPHWMWLNFRGTQWPSSPPLYGALRLTLLSEDGRRRGWRGLGCSPLVMANSKKAHPVLGPNTDCCVKTTININQPHCTCHIIAGSRVSRVSRTLIRIPHSSPSRCHLAAIIFKVKGYEVSV